MLFEQELELIKNRMPYEIQAPFALLQWRSISGNGWIVSSPLDTMIATAWSNHIHSAFSFSPDFLSYIRLANVEHRSQIEIHIPSLTATLALLKLMPSTLTQLTPNPDSRQGLAYQIFSTPPGEYLTFYMPSTRGARQYTNSLKTQLSLLGETSIIIPSISKTYPHLGKVFILIDAFNRSIFEYYSNQGDVLKFLYETSNKPQNLSASAQYGIPILVTPFPQQPASSPMPIGSPSLVLQRPSGSMLSPSVVVSQSMLAARKPRYTPLPPPVSVPQPGGLPPQVSSSPQPGLAQPLNSRSTNPIKKFFKQHFGSGHRRLGNSE